MDREKNLSDGAYPQGTHLDFEKDCHASPVSMTVPYPWKLKVESPSEPLALLLGEVALLLGMYCILLLWGLCGSRTV